MAFTGNEDHRITLADAAALTKKYRDSVPVSTRKAGFFGKATLKRIIEQDNCVGIRYYHGKNAAGEPVIVLVGADASENDLYEGELAEFSVPCLTICSSANPLNS